MFHQTSILNWLFGVPGRYYCIPGFQGMDSVQAFHKVPALRHSQWGKTLQPSMIKAHLFFLILVKIEPEIRDISLAEKNILCLKGRGLQPHISLASEASSFLNWRPRLRTTEIL